MTKQSNIEIFQSDDGRIELSVSIESDTAWITQAQMVTLFERDQSVISRHINNAFKEGEIDRKSNMQKMHNAMSDKPIAIYDLDTVISVGYRVKSNRGVQFRRWATQTLKQHLVQGYTLNQQRLQERGIEVNQVLSLLSTTLTNQKMLNDEGQTVLCVVSDYARSWSLLQAYDDQSLTESNTTQFTMKAFHIDEVLRALTSLKQVLIKKGEATELFAQLRGDGLHSAIAQIEQSFGDQCLYPNIASRAANLLYMVIKNHPLVDGNKRTGAFLFLWYLQRNHHLLAKPVEALITDNMLVALALLVAESAPTQKELMIRLIEHFIQLKV